MHDDRDFYAVRVRYAIEYFGDESRLADALGVPVDDVQRWLEGHDRPPTEMFLKMVDLLVEGR